MKKYIAKIIIFDDHQKHLILHRSATHPYYAGQLDFPGGLAEPCESLEYSACREMQEKTGIIANSTLREVARYSIYTDIEHIIYALFQMHVASLKELSIELSEEHVRYEFVSLQDLLRQDMSEVTDNYILTAVAYMKDQSNRRLV